MKKEITSNTVDTPQVGCQSCYCSSKKDCCKKYKKKGIHCKKCPKL